MFHLNSIRYLTNLISLLRCKAGTGAAPSMQLLSKKCGSRWFFFRNSGYSRGNVAYLSTTLLPMCCRGLIPRICETMFQRMTAGKVEGTSYRTEVSSLFLTGLWIQLHWIRIRIQNVGPIWIRIQGFVINFEQNNHKQF